MNENSNEVTINNLPISKFSPHAKKLWDKIRAFDGDVKKANEEVKKAKEEMEKKQRALELKESVKDELANMLAQEIDDIKRGLQSNSSPNSSETIYPNLMT